MVLTASYTFDAAVEQMLSCLLTGNTLHLLSQEDLLDVSGMRQYLLKHGISWLDATPTYLHLLDLSNLPKLRKIVSGGEPCPASLIKRYVDHMEVVNAYGPTEATITATRHSFSLEEVSLPNIIGRGVTNTFLYVLDAWKTPCPVGVKGELYIGGSGVSRGYVNRPDLNEKYFLDNPYGPGKLYKTGDMVKWRSDGTLVFLGRKDSQVKIRGYRIETQEIEAIANEQKEISQAVVTVKDEHELLLFYVLKENESLQRTELHSRLRNVLPSFMLPKTCVPVASMPMTISGKVDLKSLLSLNHFEDHRTSDSETPTEAKVRGIWEALLRRKVGLDVDFFFGAGGDSILCIQLVARLSASGLSCSVRNVFEFRTVRRLAQMFDEEGCSKMISIDAEQGLLHGQFPLLQIQQWFFQHMELDFFGVPSFWNQSFLVRLPKKIDTEHLYSCLKTLVLHHDMLRVRFERRNGQYVNVIEQRMPPFMLHVIDAKECHASLHDTLTRLQCSFDIFKGPLWSVAYVCGFDDEMPRLFFSAHHLIIDVVSWRVLWKT